MGDQSSWVLRELNRDSWRWTLGIVYIVAVASIWIAASYIVQTVVDEGVSPFLLSYICNSLFVIYIPIAEISRYLGDSVGSLLANHNVAADFSENEDLLIHSDHNREPNNAINHHKNASASGTETQTEDIVRFFSVHSEEFSPHTRHSNADKQLDSKGRWPRARVAKVSLLVCPFWFFAQLAFNLSLKYTTVTSNTILSSTSSLFTFLVSVAFLGENFSWLKLLSVFLCMGGTVIVSLADLGVGLTAIASNPVLGDAFALVSACFYAVYISLIRKQLPDETKGEGHASMTQFLGYLGLFNFIIFLPVALVLNFTKIESFHNLTWSQFTLIVGKGLIDNALGDFLWAKAILLTSTTVATAGLTIQVPIAAIVDSIVGRAPHLLDYVGAAFVILGFVGINISS